MYLSTVFAFLKNLEIFALLIKLCIFAYISDENMEQYSYQTSRKYDFERIIENTLASTAYQSDKSLVLWGDSVELLKQIPDNSVSLILTDPPYHTTKKKNIVNDTAFESDNIFLNWVAVLVQEWKRILKPNGSIYMFCSSKMANRIDSLFMEQFNVLSHIVWNKLNEPGFDGWKQKMRKESLRQWYAHSERIIFAEPAFEGNIFNVWYANVLRENRIKCGLSMKDLTEITGDYGTVNHGGAVSNWEAGRNIPNREQYDKICKAFLDTGCIESMPFYEDLIRPFDVDGNSEFTDVWNFYSVRPYNGKHPAEKPIDMLKHCIHSSSYEDDIVLDCFAGSGSTAIAAQMLGRKTISIEIEENWVNVIKNRLEKLESNEIDEVLVNTNNIMRLTKTATKSTQKFENTPTLF